MTETNVIGLVGGLGPAATIYYYNALLAECDRRALQLRLLINQADARLVLGAAARGESQDIADHLSLRMRELERAGARILAVAAVTPHMCMPQLILEGHAGIVDVVDVLNAELLDRNIERVALIGTRATTESGLFGRLKGSLVGASAREITQAHDLYMSIVRDGYVRVETAQALAVLARELCSKRSVEAIVLAGTELALVPEHTWVGLNAISCAHIHIKAIVAAATPESAKS